ncbi:MAG: hypothetical protein HZB43_06905 [candidate division Zixibacteria bacterium]|nr:hypothetical protein [candidate division Zixibacteria bacterium]
MSATLSEAQTPPAVPGHVPHPSSVVVVAPKVAGQSDSIYATEITVDASGATVVDRSGRRQHLGTGMIRIEIPDNFPDLKGVPEPMIIGPVDIHRDDIIHLTSDVTVAEDEIIRGDVICVFGGQVDIKGKVTGSAVSVFGSVNVDGQVGEDAVAPFGQVHVGSAGSVRKNVIASDIVKEPGGRIGGTRQEVLVNIFGRPWGVTRLVDPATTMTVLVLLNLLFWTFLVLLAHALAARNVVKVKDKIQSSFFKSFFMGILAQLLAIPAILLLLVTIIGIPVVIFLVPLMIAGAIVLAQAAVGLLVGEKIDQNVSLGLKTPLARTVMGYLILQSISLVALAATWAAGSDTGTGLLRLIAIALFALAILIAYVVVTVGSGAVIMTRFGTRPKDPVPVPATDQVPPDTDPRVRRGATPLPQPGTDSADTAPAVG